jgi:hypothetical protein
MSISIVCSDYTGYSVALQLRGAAELIVGMQAIQVLRLDSAEGSVQSNLIEKISDDVRIVILCVTDASLQEDGLIPYPAGFLRKNGPRQTWRVANDLADPGRTIERKGPV